MSGSQVLVLVVGGFGACVGLLFFLYNVLSFALFLREPTGGSAAPLARAAWGAGLAALFLWWMPLVGAAIGEYLARRDERNALRVGIATWLGILAGLLAKVALAFAMIGVFVAALIL